MSEFLDLKHFLRQPTVSTRDTVTLSSHRTAMAILPVKTDDDLGDRRPPIRDLRDSFASTSMRAHGVASATAFTTATDWLRKQRPSYLEHLRLTGRTLPDEDVMDPRATPFDPVLRLAAGVAPNFVNQDVLGDWAGEFVLCHNAPDYDARWDDLDGVEGSTGALAGADRAVGGLPGHVVLTTKDLSWDRSNVCALALSEAPEERRRAVDFLLRMREAAMTYARARGWTRLGLYFRFFGCEPVGEEERGIIRLHVVNLARAGPRMRRTAKINLPIDDVIEALGGRRATRRGAVIVVQPPKVGDLPTVEPLTTQNGGQNVQKASEDDEVTVIVKRVVQANKPVKENEVVIPDELQRLYTNAASTENVNMAVRDARRNTASETFGSRSPQSTIFSDVQWLSAYKRVSSPARVHSALDGLFQS